MHALCLSLSLYIYIYIYLSLPLRLCSRQRRPVIRGDSIFPVHPLDRRPSSHYYKVTNEPRKRPADYPIPLSLSLSLCSSLRFPRPSSFPNPFSSSSLFFSFRARTLCLPPLISFPVALRLRTDSRRGSRSQTRDRALKSQSSDGPESALARVIFSTRGFKLFMHRPQTSPERL